MTNARKAVLLAGIWMTFVQFAQNQLLFLGVWQDHFRDLGLSFATKPINGILWTVWSVLHAMLVRELLKTRSLGSAVSVAWLISFVMMWCALYNLQVMPLPLLIAAVPMSLAGTYGSALIIQRFGPRA